MNTFSKFTSLTLASTFSLFFSSLLFPSIGAAQTPIGPALTLEEHFHKFYDHVEEDWNRFELSIELSSDHRSALMDAGEQPGLEELEFNTLIHKSDLDVFINDIFQTPYVIPHFCHNLKVFKDPALSELNEAQKARLCRDRIEELLKPLMRGHYVVRTFRLFGSSGRSDYYKAKIMAEDLAKEKSVVINFDVILD